MITERDLERFEAEAKRKYEKLFQEYMKQYKGNRLNREQTIELLKRERNGKST